MRRWFILTLVMLVLAGCMPATPSHAQLLAASATINALRFLTVAVVIAEVNEAEADARSVTPPNVPADWIDGESLGDPAAPVVVEVWSDFLCPACQSFTRNVQPQLIDEYVATGKVRLVYRHFPLQHHEPEATRAALAGACAAEQNRFWEYEQLLMGMLLVNGREAAAESELSSYAELLQLDTDAFNRCLAEAKYADKIAQSSQAAMDAEVQFVPAVFVGDTALQESSFATIQAEIERQLAQADFAP
jgi:protein-disulfide isomerase